MIERELIKKEQQSITEIFHNQAEGVLIYRVETADDANKTERL